MKQRSLLVSGILLALALVFLFTDGHSLRERTRKFVIESALRRRIQYLCMRMAAGELNPATLCHVPLEDIPQLQAHLDRIREQDLQWYEDRGWSYLPQIECRDGRIHFLLGEREFLCDGNQAELVQAH